MPQPRYEQVHLGTTPYYHCISRCVRRAFLCGQDRYSGKNYDHRKRWIVDQLQTLGNLFAIDIAAYAVLANHLHLVLRIDAQRAGNWSDQEVVHRWTKLFRNQTVVERYLAGDTTSTEEIQAARNVIEVWRARLYDLSWFMRCLNEHIARRANREDGCQGRFWEGRFKSQALLDDAALIACMAYVDLNPVRAGVCETLEDSDFTSIQQRLRTVAEAQHERRQRPKTLETVPTKRAMAAQRPPRIPLLGFDEGRADCDGIPFHVLDYLDLVDWTGRAIRDDKKGSIPAHIRPLLERLGVNEAHWVEHVEHFGRRFSRIIGPVVELETYCDQRAIGWVRGISACRAFYAVAA